MNRPRHSSGAGRRAPRRGPAPQCQHFGRCGGCSHLDVVIDEQLHDKVREVQTLLAPFLDGRSVAFELPRVTPVHYRTKLLYPVRPDRKGAPILGIYEPMSHDIVRIKECRTQDEGLTALGVAAEAILRELELEPWDEVAGRGMVQAFGARAMDATGEVLIGVVTRPGVFPQGRELAERLMAAASGLRGSGRHGLVPVGVVRNISDRTGNYLLGDRTVPLLGRDYQEDRVDGLSFRLHFGSFYQVHRESAALLYRPALAMVGSVRGQRVVDGYGGIGTFGLRFWRAGATRVEIVEQSDVACTDAEHNARANGAGAAVTVERAAFGASAFAPEPDLLVVDPPRSGLQQDGVARVVAARPRRLLLVHCAAESLARDLAGLTAAGYRVNAARLCDLFPHTAHVELLTLLERRP